MSNCHSRTTTSTSASGFRTVTEITLPLQATAGLRVELPVEQPLSGGTT
jgi:hypothetical protein